MVELQPDAGIIHRSNKNREPTVSIGMPVYNAARYISEALDALLAQTFTDFELIISDNASTDTTAEICEKYAKTEKRIRYIKQSNNLGPVSNFEFVLAEARGRYFMWAASDDRWDKRFLEQLVKILEGDEGCGLVFSNYIEMNLENGDKIMHQVLQSNSKYAVYNYIIRTLHMCPSLIYGLYRLDNIKNMRLSNFDFADVHFVSEISLKSRVRIVDDYLYVAGTKGIRIPYSIGNKKINRTSFLKNQFFLLKNHFCFPVAQFLFFVVFLIMGYNKVRLWRY